MGPVITLTTDFGAAGPFVGVMKAVIARYAPAAPIVDLTHHVAPCQPAEAGFWVARSYHYFPTGSVHVTVVDPGVGTGRAILACAFDGHLFVAPDNGILPMITGTGAACHVLDLAWAAGQGWPAASSTFHGRDIFAPLAALLYTGTVAPAGIGPRADVIAAPAAGPARNDGGMIRGCVVAIDTWGNLITNIDADAVAAIAEPMVGVGSRDLRLRTTYGDAPPGALLALINSFGVVEVAWREGSAAKMLGLGHGAEVTVSSARA